MRLDRFHVAAPLGAEGDEIELDAEESRHLAGVLRRPVGAAITVFDGSGREARAEVVAVERRGARVRIAELHADARATGRRIVLAVALPRGGEAFDVMRTAIEAGADVVVPLLAERSVHRPEKKDEGRRQERFRRLAIAAMKQNGRNLMPVLETPRPLAELAAGPDVQGLFGSTGAAAPPLAIRLAEEAAARPNVLIAIGPEGGLSDDEERALEAAGLVGFSLGPLVLRVEIATCAAVAMTVCAAAARSAAP